MQFAPSQLAVSLILCLAASLIRPAAADTEYPRWSFSVLLGAHATEMRDLNQGLFKSPVQGNAIILTCDAAVQSCGSAEGADQNETEVIDFRFDNPLPDDKVATLAGIEFAWHPNERHALFIGINSWERTSIQQRTGNLPLQQFNVSNIVKNSRIATISFTEYKIGWRYNFFRKKKWRLYSSLSLHEVFDIDYRERWVFLFVDSPIQDLIGVRRDMVMTAQTSSLFMGGAGLGAEWFLKDWLSVGVEGSYLITEDNFTLRDIKSRDDFLPNDNISRNGLPYRKLSDSTLGYQLNSATPSDVENPATRKNFYRRMKLNFDGWRLVFRVNFYY